MLARSRAAVCALTHTLTRSVTQVHAPAALAPALGAAASDFSSMTKLASTLSSAGVAAPRSVWACTAVPVRSFSHTHTHASAPSDKTAAASISEDGSHSDFAPQPSAAAGNPSDPSNLRKQVDELIKGHKVVLFMKGTPAAPQCGFSGQVVRLLHYYGVDVHGVDILAHPALRSLMKEYSSWPTFPQLYVDGEFIGGRDIAVSLHESGELKKLLGVETPEAGKA